MRRRTRTLECARSDRRPRSQSGHRSTQNNAMERHSGPSRVRSAPWHQCRAHTGARGVFVGQFVMTFSAHHKCRAKEEHRPMFVVNAVKLYHDPSLLTGTPPFDFEVLAVQVRLHRVWEHQKPTPSQRDQTLEAKKCADTQTKLLFRTQTDGTPSWRCVQSTFLRDSVAHGSFREASAAGGAGYLVGIPGRRGHSRSAVPLRQSQPWSRLCLPRFCGLGPARVPLYP